MVIAMKITEITVSYNRRIQVKQYEPAEAGVAIKASIGEHESFKEVTKKLYELAREEVYSELAKDLKKQDNLKVKFKNL